MSSHDTESTLHWLRRINKTEASLEIVQNLSHTERLQNKQRQRRKEVSFVEAVCSECQLCMWGGAEARTCAACGLYGQYYMVVHCKKPCWTWWTLCWLKRSVRVSKWQCGCREEMRYIVCIPKPYYLQLSQIAFFQILARKVCSQRSYASNPKQPIHTR